MLNWFHVMSEDSLQRLARLADIVRAETRGFLERCSNVRLIAVTDLPRAFEECRSLFDQTLNVSGRFDDVLSQSVLARIRDRLSSGCVDQACIEDLVALRDRYVQQVLQPTVSSFLRQAEVSLADLRAAYDIALRLDGLLCTAKFLGRLTIYSPRSSGAGSS